jgi:hypothetical protein
VFSRTVSPISGDEKSSFLAQGTVSRLARNAAFNAKPPCGIGTSYVARIFSITRSIKKLKIYNSRASAVMNCPSGSTSLTSFGSTSCQQTMSTQLRCKI